MQKSKRAKFSIVLGILLLLALGLFFAYKKGLLKNFQKDLPGIQSIVPESQKEEIKLTVISSEVTVKSESSEKTYNKGDAVTILSGDTVSTGKTGIATITYTSGTVMRMAPNSALTIDNEGSTTNLNHETGSIFVRFKKVLGIQEDLHVETPTAVASVRGTRFASVINKAKDTKIIVTESEVEVYKKDDTGKILPDTKQLVKEGLEANIKRREAIKVIKQNLTAAEKNWLEYNLESDNMTKSEILEALIQKIVNPSPTATPSASKAPTTATASPKPVTYISQMLGTGYNVGRVKTETGEHPIACYGASQGSVRVITDSANETDCKTDCPVLPLHEFATRNGGTAAINGMYFCPADYPACSDRKNSFDTLFFNSRVKRYINSDNNVYSSIPFLVVHSDGSPRFVGRSADWGRDTGIQAGTAGNPILVQGGNISAVEGNLDEKQRTVKANRGAFVQKGGNLYLCIVGSATVMDTARVYKALQVDNAINIDGGGSSALWVSGSYKYGPGRNIPTAIIFAPR